MLSSAPKPNDLLLYVEISQSSFAATIMLRKSAGQSAGLQTEDCTTSQQTAI